MNLFVETLSDYIKNQWDQALNDTGGTKEALLIVQSLDPDTTFNLFSELDTHRLDWSQRADIDCEFRVATGLWMDWRRFSREASERFADYPHWIDRDDRLTAYRSLVRSEDKDGLVVVLVGLNHATDQGSLSDFHLVDEKRVWEYFGQSFVPWIETLNTRLALSGTEREIEHFDEQIHELFDVQPRQLARLADFLEHEVIGPTPNLYSLSELIERFQANLPFWDIPPLLTSHQSGRRTHKKGRLKEAAGFITHQRFKTATERRKAWQKLEKAFADGTLELPQTTTPDLYADLDDYRETLHAFIHTIDTRARECLLQTDLTPVLEVLKARKPNQDGPKPTKVPRLNGFSLDVMLDAVWKTLVEYRKKHPSTKLFESLAAIHIEIQSFNHDLQDDPNADTGTEYMARALLRGCLGGLPDLIAGIDWRLPIDSDQIDEPREHWERTVDLSLTLDTETITLGKSRARPYIRFNVAIHLADDNDGKPAYTKPFQWAFGPTHPERVRYEGARLLIDEHWPTLIDAQPLPAFQVPAVNLTALYYAADEEEANRLVSQALGELTLIDLLADLAPNVLDPALAQATRTLSHTYYKWLGAYVEQGYYTANAAHYLTLLNGYVDLAERLLDIQVRGSAELLRRFYKAFLLVDDSLHPNDAFLRAGVAWGLTPAVIELTYARARFLCDGFPEVAADLVLGRDSQAPFDQLLNLAEIHRPLAGLVVNAEHKLSAEIKSFGLLHHLGEPPDVEKSLAVQTLLREDDSDDDVADDTRLREESEIVVQVLNDYLSLYPFAEDGLRILALHVEELGIILSGVDRFLREYLKRSSADWPAFHCDLMVYTTSSSPMAMENRLMAWRDALTARYRERGRPLVLSVGHRFAPTREQMDEMAKQEARLYDIAFLFRFLSGGLIGEAEPASPFTFDYNNIGPFPIAEYPRPIQLGDVLKRQSLLSNRRLRIQTRHADLSARLRHPQDTQPDHLIFGRIDFSPWATLVDGLHARAQWVACIDPFVDKRLLRTAEGQERRKILGFTSGLGAYGELNLSISTEQDTLGQLAARVRGELVELLPFQDAAGFADMAERVIEESEEIIGLSALHAVVGEGQKVREVVGFAAIRRLLAIPSTAAMTQLLPIDSLLHWFKGSDGSHRPDLLQLSLILRDDDVPLIQATLIECKLAQQNPEHLNKALLQTQDGLSHLSQLLIPNRRDIQRAGFDRRYWWAQLQRAMTSRGVVSLAESDWRRLDKALEQITEGYFEIAWRAAIFTFWTDTEGATPSLTPIPLPQDVIQPPLWAPTGFAIQHVALGHDGLTALFDDRTPSARLELDPSEIRIGPALEPSEPSLPSVPAGPDELDLPTPAPERELTSRWMPACDHRHAPNDRAQSAAVAARRTRADRTLSHHATAAGRPQPRDSAPNAERTGRIRTAGTRS
jgi:DNA phosphorothioation-dependent restriction protein DptH